MEAQPESLGRQPGATNEVPLIKSLRASFSDLISQLDKKISEEQDEENDQE
jgi:hypothetical protein